MCSTSAPTARRTKTSDERFDRTAFARRAVDLLEPKRTTVAICSGVSRIRVESGRVWGRPFERWALLAIPSHASRRAIVVAVAQLSDGSRAYALDVLMDRGKDPSGVGPRVRTSRMSEIYITREGAKRLQKELSDLLWKIRPPVVQDVTDAAAQGDRSENAEYIYGKKKLREIDRRIHWLTKRLESATVVEPRTDGTRRGLLRGVRRDRRRGRRARHLSYCRRGRDRSRKGAHLLAIAARSVAPQAKRGRRDHSSPAERRGRADHRLGAILSSRVGARRRLGYLSGPLARARGQRGVDGSITQSRPRVGAVVDGRPRRARRVRRRLGQIRRLPRASSPHWPS